MMTAWDWVRILMRTAAMAVLLCIPGLGCDITYNPLTGFFDCVGGTGGSSGTSLTAAATSGADNIIWRSVGDSRAVEATGVTITDTGQVVAPGGLASTGATAGVLQLNEPAAAGTEYTGWKAPVTLGASTLYVVPSTPPSGLQALVCDTPSGGDSACSFGSVAATQWHHFRGAVCQNTVAGAGFSTPSSNAPTAACDSGTNTLFGVLQFTEASTQSAQNWVQLPDSFTSAEVELYWRTSATSGDVAWQLQTACLATSEALGNAASGGPSWNTTQELTSTADGTARDIVRIALTSLTTTGCAANELLLLRISRDPTDAQDTIAATAELVSLSIKVTP